MTIERPRIIAHTNLSLAWADAFCQTMTGGAAPNAGFVVSITDFAADGEAVEQPEIRRALDDAIEEANAGGDGPGKEAVKRVEATASTIFPKMCWSPDRQRPAEELYQRYHERILPKLKSRCGANKKGTYFARMTDVARPKKPGEPMNQLKEVIGYFRQHETSPGNSATQVAIRDPAIDPVAVTRLGFPCLQQVSFGRSEGRLTAAGYYPTQSVFERGYGNCLGLCRLANFVAYQVGIPLGRVDVFVFIPRPPDVKKPLKALEQRLRQYLEQVGSAS